MPQKIRDALTEKFDRATTGLRSHVVTAAGPCFRLTYINRFDWCGSSDMLFVASKMGSQALTETRPEHKRVFADLTKAVI
jgi:hypothetical protein